VRGDHKQENDEAGNSPHGDITSGVAGTSVPLGRYPEGPPAARQQPLRPVHV